MNTFLRIALSLIVCISLGVLTLVVAKQSNKKADKSHRTASGSVEEKQVAKKTTTKSAIPQPVAKQPEVLAKAAPKVVTSPTDFSNSPVVRKGPMENDAVALARFQNSPVVRKPEQASPVQVRNKTAETAQDRLNDPCYVQSLYMRVDQEKCKTARLGPPHVVERAVWKEQTFIGNASADPAALIKRVFPDAPIMLKVAWCESKLMHTLPNGRVVRGGLTPSDIGLFQISLIYHAVELARLGLNPFKLEDNVQYARILYDRDRRNGGNGLRDWDASARCHSAKR